MVTLQSPQAGASLCNESHASIICQCPDACSPLKPGLLYATPHRSAFAPVPRPLQSPQAGASLCNAEYDVMTSESNSLQSPQAGASLCNQHGNRVAAGRGQLACSPLKPGLLYATESLRYISIQ